MSKSIPKKPIKVSKTKKTLPVEIDWGQGMKDRLRYISPSEEALIQRNRSTMAERYYGGIRAYPDPGDTAAGDYGQGTSSSGGLSTGTTTGTTTSTTTGTTSTTTGTTTGSTYGEGSNTDVGGREGGSGGVGSGVGGDSGTSTAAGTSPGGVGGSTAGAVSASASAEPGYAGAISGGAAESAFRNVEGAHRSGVNSLEDGRINSGNIVTTTAPTYSQSQYSYASSVPAPVTAASTAESVYGPGYVTDDMLPDYSSTLPAPPQYVTAQESLSQMLARGSGVKIGPAPGPTPPSMQTSGNVWSGNDFSSSTGPRVDAYGRGVSISDTTDRTAGTPSTMASEATMDRLASGRSAIGTTQPAGTQPKQISDRVPSATSNSDGIASIETPSEIDTNRAISTVAAAENIPAPVVSSAISSPAIPVSSMSQGVADWTDAYKTNTMTYTPSSAVPVGSVDTSINSSTFGKVTNVGSYPPPGDPSSLKVDREDSVNQAKPFGKRSDLPSNISTEDGQYSVTPDGAYTPSEPGPFRLPNQTNALPPGYAEAYNISGTPARTRGIPSGTVGQGVAGIGDEDPPSPLDITDETGGVATGEGEVVEGPSQEGILGLTGDEATKAAKKAGIQGDVAYADWFRDDPGQLGILRETPDETAVADPTNMAKVHQRAMANKFEGEDPYLTADENIRADISEGVERIITARTGLPGRVLVAGGKRMMGVEDASDFLGRPSYEQDALYDYSKESAEKYGRSNFQGDREGGQDYAANLENNWRNGIGIPNPGDPEYAAYMYWLNSSGWGWS